MSTTTARERLQRVIDDLTDEELEELEITVKLALIPEDDEPETEEERLAVEEGRAAYRRGEFISADEGKRRLLP